MHDEIMITVIASGFDRETAFAAPPVKSVQAVAAQSAQTAAQVNPQVTYAAPQSYTAQPGYAAQPEIPVNDPSVPDFLKNAFAPVETSSFAKPAGSGFHTVGAVEPIAEPVATVETAGGNAGSNPGLGDTLETPNFNSLFTSASPASTYTDLAASRPEPVKQPDPVPPARPDT